MFNVSAISRRMQHCGEDALQDMVRKEETSDGSLMTTAKKGMWFAVRLRQLTAAVVSEVEESQKLLNEVR